MVTSRRGGASPPGTSPTPAPPVPAADRLADGWMDRERAEAHLRMLAETELRRVAPHPAGTPGLSWCGALRRGRARRQDRHADRGRLRAGPDHPDSRAGWPAVPGPAAARLAGPGWQARPGRAPRAGARRPPGTAIDVRAGDLSGQVRLLSFAQRGLAGLLTVIARTCGEHEADAVASLLGFSATDDRGNPTRPGLDGSGESPGRAGDPLPESRSAARPALARPGDDVRPSPPRAVLDGPPPAPPEVTVSATGAVPGEHFLNGIAMRLLATIKAAYPQHLPLHVAGLTVGLAVDGLATSSRRCRRAGRFRRAARVPPSPPRCATTWTSRATASPRRPPVPCPNPGAACSSSNMARRLTRRPARLRWPPSSPGPPESGSPSSGLHDSGDRTVVFMHASGMSGGGPYEQDRWPVIWIRDSAG